MKTTCINGEIQAGDIVLSTVDDEYPCLVGRVIKVALLGSPEHDTDNESDDVYVNFDGNFSKQRVREIEKTFSDLFDEKKTMDDIALDMVIMNPDCLIKLMDVSDSVLTWITQSEVNAVSYGYKILHDLYDELKNPISTTTQVQEGQPKS